MMKLKDEKKKRKKERWGLRLWSRGLEERAEEGIGKGVEGEMEERVEEEVGRGSVKGGRRRGEEGMEGVKDGVEERKKG